jgi:hypothetical protein
MQLSDDKKTDEQIPYPEWQKPFEQALLELDEEKLSERVAAAESAIFRRLQVIAYDPLQHAERHAIEDALSSLRILKRTPAQTDLDPSC